MTARMAGVSTIARRTQLSEPTVRKRLRQAEAEGRIAAQHGQWPLDQACAILRADVDPALVAGHAVSGLGDVKLPETATLSKAKAAAEVERAKKLALANERAAGNLVRVDEVKAAGADLVVHVRTTLLAVPGRVAAKVAAISDPIEVQRILDEEIRRALKQAASPDAFFDNITLGLGGDDDA